MRVAVRSEPLLATYYTPPTTGLLVRVAVRREPANAVFRGELAQVGIGTPEPHLLGVRGRVRVGVRVRVRVGVRVRVRVRVRVGVPLTRSASVPPSRTYSG